MVATYLLSTSNRNYSHLYFLIITVATYLLSTSNRNVVDRHIRNRYVATYLLSTSNRNLRSFLVSLSSLLHIFFLHQTATVYIINTLQRCCYISSFYIKPQLVGTQAEQKKCCYISSFYIKPQLSKVRHPLRLVATYLLSTSNRNFGKEEV